MHLGVHPPTSTLVYALDFKGHCHVNSCNSFVQIKSQNVMVFSGTKGRHQQHHGDNQ